MLNGMIDEDAPRRSWVSEWKDKIEELKRDAEKNGLKYSIANTYLFLIHMAKKAAKNENVQGFVKAHVFVGISFVVSLIISIMTSGSIPRFFMWWVGMFVFMWILVLVIGEGGPLLKKAFANLAVWADKNSKEE